MATPIPQNRAEFTPADIAATTGGRLLRDGVASVGVSTDSRTVVPGCAFIAIGGEKFDGHAFVSTAASAGASTFVIAREDAAPLAGAVILVGDTRRALGDLARAHRRRAPARVVAVTGSAGKTTTRKAIVALLERLAPGAVHAPPGNLNNDIGVPMTLLGLRRDHAFAVIELGTNHRGEIARLAEIAAPDVGVVTLVAAAHTEGIGSVDEVAREKGALFAALSPAGVAIGNADDARVMAELGRAPAESKVGYGLDAGANYRITTRTPRGLAGADLIIGRPNGSLLRARTPLLGVAGALATAAAVAVFETLALWPLTDEEATAALASLGASDDGRLAPHLLADGTVVIDDSYNANPASMAVSLVAAEELAQGEGKRLVVVVGEMRELGALSPAEHATLAERIAESSAALVVAVGGAAAVIADRARATGKEAIFVPDAEQAAKLVVARVHRGDLVLVKGSRGVGLERVVRALSGGAAVSGRGPGASLHIRVMEEGP